MILYHAANLCCYIKCIVHKMLYAADESACFIGYNWLLEKYGTSKIFEYEHGFSPMLGVHGSQNELSPEDAESYIVEYFDNIFAAWGIFPTGFSELHIGSYYTAFAAYLNMKQLKHFVHEECAGAFNDTEVWAEDKQKYKTALAIRSKYGMYQCENDNILIKFAIISRLNKGIDITNIVNFEVYDEIFLLSEFQRNILANYFKLPKQFLRKANNVLLLTEWFNLLGEKRCDKGLLHIYAALLDYYCEGKSVCIKPHPADPMRDYYAASFENTEILQSVYPTELMGLIPNIGFDAAVTISSSSIYTVGGFCKRTATIGKSFTWFYKLLNKLFTAFALADFLKSAWKSQYRYGIFDDDYAMLSEINSAFPICKWKKPDKPLPKDLYIIDKIRWSDTSPKFDIALLLNAGYNNIFIFTNSDKADVFFAAQQTELLDYVVPIKLRKQVINAEKEPLCELYEEVIYLFCKNSATREKANQFSIEKQLNAMGVILTASACAGQEKENEFIKLRMRVLEKESRSLRKGLECVGQKYTDMITWLSEL